MRRGFEFFCMDADIGIEAVAVEEEEGGGLKRASGPDPDGSRVE